MSGRIALAWILGLALVALHLDFWRPKRDVLWFGFLPEELTWRLGWLVLAIAYLIWLTVAVWKPREDPPRRREATE